MISEILIIGSIIAAIASSIEDQPKKQEVVAVKKEAPSFINYESKKGFFVDRAVYPIATKKHVIVKKNPAEKKDSVKLSFKLNSYILEPEEKIKLDNFLLSHLSKIKSGNEICILGKSSPEGMRLYNLKLAKKRALSAKKSVQKVLDRYAIKSVKIKVLEPKVGTSLDEKEAIITVKPLFKN